MVRNFAPTNGGPVEGSIGVLHQCRSAGAIRLVKAMQGRKLTARGDFEDRSIDVCAAPFRCPVEVSIGGLYYWRDRPERFLDHLSDVLLLLKPRTYRAGGFDLGGDFAIKFPKHEGIKCYTVVSGQCCMTVEGVLDAVRLTTGNCFLLAPGISSCLASDLKLTLC